MSWRVGMEAVCVYEGLWQSANTGEVSQPLIEKGDVFTVKAVMRRPHDASTLWKRVFGKKAVYLRFKAYPTTWFEAEAFRPAQRASSEIAARIKACRPAKRRAEV